MYKWRLRFLTYIEGKLRYLKEGLSTGGSDTVHNLKRGQVWNCLFCTVPLGVFVIVLYYEGGFLVSHYCQQFSSVMLPLNSFHRLIKNVLLPWFIIIFTVCHFHQLPVRFHSSTLIISTVLESWKQLCRTHNQFPGDLCNTRRVRCGRAQIYFIDLVTNPIYVRFASRLEGFQAPGLMEVRTHHPIIRPYNLQKLTAFPNFTNANIIYFQSPEIR